VDLARKPARKEKAAVGLAQDIVKAMYESRMKPGDRYLSEAEAQRKHGAARNTLREALRFLEIQGVLTVRAGPGGGPEVGSPSWPHLASTIALLLQFADAPFRTVIEARTVIEPGMAEMAARHATDAEIAEMAGDLDDIERSIGSFRLFSPAYLRFWRHLAESTHNPLIAFLSPALRAIVESAGFVPNEVYRTEIVARLREVHALIAARDGEGARLKMVALEQGFLKRLNEGYPRQMERVVAWSDLDVTVGDEDEPA
jgi:GntR family transcriptional repressor for pyruvate dehydrogenase complex